MPEHVLVHHLVLGLLLVLPRSRRSPERRADFLDPDFGVKASFNLARRKGGKCLVGAEADSEIPELGLDSGRVNVDCDLSPVQMAGAALKAARHYGEQRRARKYQQQPSKVVKRKRTSIHIDREYERDSGAPDEEQDAADQAAPADEQSSAVDGTDDDDDD